MQIGNNSPINPRNNRPGGRREIDLTHENREGLQKAADRAVDDIEHQVGKVDLAEAARDAAAVKEEARVSEARSADRGQDKIELSAAARNIASDELPGVRGSKESPDARAERVADLKAAFEKGDLHSPERLARAAERLLMSDD